MSLNLAARGSRTSDTGATMIVRQMDPKVYQKRSNFAAFVTLLRLMQMRRTAQGMNKTGMAYGSSLKNVENPKFEMSNIDIGTPVDTLNGAVGGTTGDTSIVVDNILMWTAGDVGINLRTKERFLVTTVTSGTSTLTVTRQWGASDALAAPSAAAMLDGDSVALVGNAFEEGGSTPTTISFSPEEFYNYTQIFKRATSGTATNQATKFYGDVNKLDRQKRLVWDQFLKDRAAAYYRGVRNKTTGTLGNPIRTTGGLEQWITTNLMELTGGITYNDFIDFGAMIYGYGGEEKLILCNTAMSTLLQKEVFGSTKVHIEVSPMTKEFGVAISRVKTISGSFDFKEDRSLNELYPETMAVGFGLEMGLIQDMILRPDVWRENVQTPGTDGRTDEALGESGIQIINEERHGIITVDLS
jgi:hypothetical protein